MMILTRNLHNIRPLFLKNLNYPIGTTTNIKKSYYEILGIDKKASPKEIRKVFLSKAREVHPDHNSDPQAQQEFKLLKEAYETLKDPQKRYMYDSGISTDGVDEQVYTGEAEWQAGRKYYENKWYGFKPNAYPDQRDEYYERRNEQTFEERMFERFKKVLGVGVIVVGFLGYDYLRNRKSAEDAERKHIKALLEGEDEKDRKARKLARYINQRAKANKIDE